MATPSAHTDDATASRVSEMARLEDRTRSQIMAAALRWYVRLSAPARDALRRIEAQGDQAIEEAAARILGRHADVMTRRGLHTCRDARPRPPRRGSSEKW